MPNLEQITIIGRIQPSDPEVRFSPSGTQVLSFRVVCNRNKKNKDTGEWDQEADWFSVIMFGERAANIADKLSKGDHVMVVGRFSTRAYTTQSGVERLSLEVLADQVLPLGSAGVVARAQAEQAAAPLDNDDTEVLPF